MGWFATKFRSPPAVVTGPPLVQVDFVGRNAIGKTTLLDRLYGGALHQPFPSGLSLGVEDPRQLVDLVRRSRGSQALLRSQGLESTQSPQKYGCSLLDGGREQVRLHMGDAKGQILTWGKAVRAEAAEEFDRYVSRISRSDALWLTVPCIPSPHQSADIERFVDDFQIAATYALRALNQRRQSYPCVLALLITRIDARYQSVADAKKRLPRELLGWPRRQCSRLAEHPAVGEVAIFPVSSLGFGTTRIKANGHANGATGWEKRDPALSEPVWILKENVSPRAFNLRPLLAWTMLAALRHRPVDRLGQAAAKMSRICRLLQEDLKEMGAWYVPVKSS